MLSSVIRPQICCWLPSFVLVVLGRAGFWKPKTVEQRNSWWNQTQEIHQHLRPYTRKTAGFWIRQLVLQFHWHRGNYMVRNTPFARDFLMRWAEYYDQRPSGFSSADNGAIQLVDSWTKIKRPWEKGDQHPKVIPKMFSKNHNWLVVWNMFYFPIYWE